MKSAHRGVGLNQYSNILQTGFVISLFLFVIALLSSCNSNPTSNTTTVPSAPTISSLDGGSGSVMITWAPVANASFYDIYWAADSTVSISSGTVINGASSPYTLTGLNPNTQYAFIVTAINASGESKASSVATTTTKTGLASPVFSKIVSQTGSVTLSWTAISGANSYNIYWAADTTVSPNTGNKITQAHSPQTINGLAAGTQYSFIVTAVDNGGNEGTPSSVAKVLTQPRSYVFVANSGDNTSSILAIGSSGTLNPIPDSLNGVGKTPKSIASADLNGNGMPDLITANSGGATVSVLMNSNGIAFADQLTFRVGNGPSAVTAADINSDGEPDLVVANQNSNNVSVLLNTTPIGSATPTFAAQSTFNVGGGPVSVSVKDMNSDGKPDIVVANGTDGTISILLNTTSPGATTPSFSTQQTFAVVGGVVSATVADVNHDGKPDLIVANKSTNTVSVLLNTTAAGSTSLSFAAQSTFSVGNGVASVTADDINGDGKPDIIVPNESDNTVSVLMNTTAAGAASASFTGQRVFDVNIGPVSVKMADVNGDGKADMIVSDSGSDMVSVLLNSTTPGTSTAEFDAQQNFDTGSKPMGIAIARFGTNGNTGRAVLSPKQFNKR